MKPRMQFVSRKKRLFGLPLRRFIANRNVKDRLFCYIFEQDRGALLELYNALNHTDYRDAQALQIVTLDNVVYMSMKNDMAFLLAGALNLYEHQSTFCPNLPLRFLLYIAAEYESLVAKAKANIYGKTLISLPAPQCVVFYNGDKAMPDEQYLRLTDAFTDVPEAGSPSCLELKVRMLNINYGHNSQLTGDCKRLDEYSRFVARIKEYHQNGDSVSQAIENAVVYCIDHGIMEDILLPFRAEVTKMLLTEYNEKKYMRLFRKEAREEGLKEGREEGLKQGLEEGLEQGLKQGQNRLINTMLQNGASPEHLSEITGLSLSEINAITKNKKS
ncbi:MAG: hypothetical protein HFH93_09035 [Lachnospiraceae bacterium]|nr:hypothetical protein [Lachnospiraceae bacterium]